MPIQTTRKLSPTGKGQYSRVVVLPKNWWSGLDPQPKSINLILDKAGILSPSTMTDKDVTEAVLFILKQQNKEGTIKAFERLFDIKIIEGGSE